MNSLRHRLLLWISISLLIMFLLAGLVLFAYVQHELGLHFDAVLLERATILARTTEQMADGGLYFEFLEAELVQHHSADSDEYFQVWTRQGQTMGRSPSLEPGGLPVSLPLIQDPFFQNLLLPDGRLGRMVVLSFLPHEEEVPALDTYIMALAIPRTELETILSRVLHGLFFSGLALLLGLFPGIWLSVNRALQSLDQLGRQTSAIKADDLSFRFPVDKIPRELQPISLRLNDLLHRLQAAFDRERRFTADAAHELRTPIAELKTLAEVGLAETLSDMSEMHPYFEDALAIAQHMELLVSLLLTLSRCQSGQQNIEKTFCPSVRAVLADVWTLHKEEAAARGLNANLEDKNDFSVESDPALLAAIFDNLLSNAVAYTPEGASLWIKTDIRDKGASVIISNTVQGLEESDLPRFFEPFWRKKQTFSSESHAGLGLALVEAYAHLLNIDLSLSLDLSERLLLCRLTFPEALKADVSGEKPAFS
ncbi:MAG: HAMP domain-containing histidine kinase [Candidatus Hydrogenedens sp.]|nr:HAMP domain-containing histidine kinase [Candidatus Hydrogenedens sp.]